VQVGSRDFQLSSQVRIAYHKQPTSDVPNYSFFESSFSSVKRLRIVGEPELVREKALDEKACVVAEDDIRG
jgi:hypothetical protein